VALTVVCVVVGIPTVEDLQAMVMEMQIPVEGLVDYTRPEEEQDWVLTDNLWLKKD
jgi:hypothetical protein